MITNFDFFQPATCKPIINILVQETPNQSGSLQYSFLDDIWKNEIIESFRIGNMVCHATYISGEQVVFHLHNLELTNINIVNNENLPINQDEWSIEEKKLLLMRLAISSIMRHLRKTDSIDQDGVMFQARFNGIPTGLSIFPLDQQNQTCSTSFNGMITHTYVYFDENRACLFLNSAISAAQIEKIRESLNDFLPELENLDMTPSFTGP